MSFSDKFVIALIALTIVTGAAVTLIYYSVPHKRTEPPPRLRLSYRDPARAERCRAIGFHVWDDPGAKVSICDICGCRRDRTNGGETFTWPREAEE